MSKWESFELELDIGIDDPDIVTVRGQWCAGRPAPYSRNPDSPAFSDPGDPPGIEIDDIEGKLEPEYYSDLRILDRIEEMCLDKLESDMNY